MFVTTEGELQSRIAKALLHLAESTRLSGVSASSIGLRVSQRELGNIAGGSRKSVNKHLQAWHRAGLDRPPQEDDRDPRSHGHRRLVALLERRTKPPGWMESGDPNGAVSFDTAIHAHERGFHFKNARTFMEKNPRLAAIIA